ncbi:MAG: hypothetical protein ACJAQ3_000245 [Planctomycetota bacterium]|jgi:hypothetical protein
MRINHLSHRGPIRGLSALGAATLLLTTSVASAQTPMEIEEAVDQANADLERANDETLRLNEDGSTTIRTTDASFGAPTLRQEGTAGVPSEGYFFDEDAPRSFWRSENGRRIVHPVTAPNYNDDAYVTSDVRGHYINHQLPTNANTNGGAARVYGFQLRKALDERFQVQISKLGFNDVHLNGSEEGGLDDLAVAVKYAFLQNWESQTHASIGLGYELGIGDRDTFGGDDELRVFGAFNKGFDRSHIGLSVNAMFATGSEDANGDSDRLSAHLHYDYEINEQISPIVELNYYSTLSNGSPVTPFSGLDLANLGGNEGEDALSLGLGGEFRVQRDLAVRLAYESPLTSDDDLWGYRWTASAVWRF